jgi:repressor LexA
MKAPPSPLTSKQARVLQFLRDFHSAEDRLPSSYEISRHFGWASQTSAMGHLRSLARKGVIEYREDQANRRAWWRFTRNQ